MKWLQRYRPSDDRQALHEFSRSLALVVDPQELHAGVAARLQELFGFEHVGILLREDDASPFRLAAWRGPPSGPAHEFGFAAEGRLARWLRVNEMLFVPAEDGGVLDFIDAEERAVLERLGTVACVPLVAINRLTGFVSVGRTPGSAGFGLAPPRRELLSMLAAQAALAFENAALLREQKTRLKRMYHSERLATAGELAAGAAHEIRNPLTAIRSAIQYIRGDYAPESERGELLGEILTEVDRIDAIVSGLLSFARAPEVAWEDLDLDELLRQSVGLIVARAREQRVRVEVQSAGPIRLRADAGLLKQVVVNLLINALQAMPGGGALHVAAEVRGGSAVVRVRDTGCGIAPEHLERVFDPFFTTKPQGTGLGLSICYGIVERHRGEMTIESEPGRGTMVTVTLPLRQPR